MHRIVWTLVALWACSTGVDPLDQGTTLTADDTATVPGPTTTTTPTAGVTRGIPDGLIALFDDDECPAGWSEWFPARGRGLVAVATGAEVGIEVGDPLDELVPRSHAHTAEVVFDLPGSGVAGISGCCNTTPGQSGLRTATGSIDATTPDHPLLAMRVCRYASAIEPAAHSLPVGMSAYFDRKSCPTGMAPAAEASGYFLVGAIANAGVGVPVGAALGSGEVRAHAHPATFTLDLPSYSVVLAGGGNNDHAKQGLHTVQVTTDDGSMGLPYVQALLCTVEAEAPPTPSDELLTTGATIWSDAADCPEDWEEQTDLRGRIPVGAPSLSPVGSTWAMPFDDGEDRVHDHPFAYTVDLPEQGITGAPGCCHDQMTPKGTVDLGGSVDQVSSGLPWIQMRACRRPDGGQGA